MPSFNRLIPSEQAGDFVALKMHPLSSAVSAQPKSAAPAPKKTEDPLALGYKRGYGVGYAQAEQDLQGLLNARVTQLAPLLASAREQVAQLQAESAQRVLELAMMLAEQIVRAEIKINATPLMGVIHESLELIAESVARISVHVHPSDAQAVREELLRADSRITVVEDRDVAQGGCKLITSQGEIDATLKYRVDAARMALGLERSPELEGLESALSGSPLV